MICPSLLKRDEAMPRPGRWKGGWRKGPEHMDFPDRDGDKQNSPPQKKKELDHNPQRRPHAAAGERNGREGKKGREGEPALERCVASNSPLALPGICE